MRKLSTEQKQTNFKKNAVEAVKSGITIYAASKEFYIPWSTLTGHLTKRNNGKENKYNLVLTSSEEERVVKWIIELGEMGFPITKNQLIHSIASLVKDLKRKNKFK